MVTKVEKENYYIYYEISKTCDYQNGGITTENQKSPPEGKEAFNPQGAV